MTMPFFLNKVLSGLEQCPDTERQTTIREVSNVAAYKEEGDSEFFTTRNDADQVAGSKFHLRLRVS